MMAEETPRPAPAGERLWKVRRLLGNLKVTEEYLRQYPALAEKVAALVEEARPSERQG